MSLAFVHFLRVEGEEIGVQDFAESCEAICVDRGLVVDALQCPFTYANMLREPCVGATLAAHLVTYQITNVYLHSDCCLCSVLPIPWVCRHYAG